jgi:DNA-3-methyladenine glycosylase II
MSSPAVTFVMTEHPSWAGSGSARWRVVALPDDSRCLVTTDSAALTYDWLRGHGTAPVDSFSLGDDDLAVPALADALQVLGPVVRLRNADLWDAIGTGILRQVIRAGQSKKLYRAFCAAHGESVALPDGGTYRLFPTPAVVLSLADAEYSQLGMAFKLRPLQAAAEAYLHNGAKWRELSPAALVDELQGVPRIGPWTAGAAVADYSNDWSLYPYADLAVRTWAKRAAPAHDWPTDEPTFGRVWRELAGEHLAALTLLTLAWGSRHGEIG